MTFTLSPDLLMMLGLELVGLAALWGAMGEKIRTLFSRVQKVEEHHDRHVEKLDTLCTQVSALVARFDTLLGLGREGALTRGRA